MPKYTLTYFSARGRGAFSRLLFAAAGQEFVDKRIEFSGCRMKGLKTPVENIVRREMIAFF